MKEELERVTDMHARALVPETRLLQIQRDVPASAARTCTALPDCPCEGQVSETELRIIELDATARAEAQRELREVEARIAELMQKARCCRRYLEAHRNQGAHGRHRPTNFRSTRSVV